MPRSELISWVSPFKVIELPIFLAFDDALIDMLRNRVHDVVLAVRIGIGDKPPKNNEPYQMGGRFNRQRAGLWPLAFVLMRPIPSG